MSTQNMVALACAIAFIAIIALFSQELSRFGKKIFAIKGAIVIVPLFLMSFITYYLQYEVIEILYFIHKKLYLIYDMLFYIAPKQFYPMQLALIGTISIISIGPSILLNYLSYRRTHKPYSHRYFVSTLLWLCCVFALIVIPSI